MERIMCKLADLLRNAFQPMKTSIFSVLIISVLFACSEDEPNPDVPEEEKILTTAKTKDCSSTFTFTIQTSVPFNENLIIFRNDVLDRDFTPEFINYQIDETITGDCGSKIDIYRGHVFSPFKVPFNNLFDTYEIQTSSTASIKTKQYDLVAGYGGWHEIKINVTQTGQADVTLQFYQDSHTFRPDQGTKDYTFVVFLETPYYKTLEISATSLSGNITTKINDLKIRDFKLYERLKTIPSL
jgi:hypothetical protein